jgi:hypothetical protein
MTSQQRNIVKALTGYCWPHGSVLMWFDKYVTTEVAICGPFSILVPSLISNQSMTSAHNHMTSKAQSDHGLLHIFQNIARMSNTKQALALVQQAVGTFSY